MSYRPVLDSLYATRDQEENVRIKGVPFESLHRFMDDTDTEYALHNTSIVSASNAFVQVRQKGDLL